MSFIAAVYFIRLMLHTNSMLRLLKDLTVEGRNLTQFEEDRGEYFYCLRVGKNFLSTSPEQILTVSEKLIILTTLKLTSKALVDTLK